MRMRVSASSAANGSSRKSSSGSVSNARRLRDHRGSRCRLARADGTGSVRVSDACQTRAAPQRAARVPALAQTLAAQPAAKATACAALLGKQSGTALALFESVPSSILPYGSGRSPSTRLHGSLSAWRTALFAALGLSAAAGCGADADSRVALPGENGSPLATPGEDTLIVHAGLVCQNPLSATRVNMSRCG
jgi:hypothetical protein